MEQSIESQVSELLSQKELFTGEQALDVRTYSPLTLAFIGDAVFSLYIRTMLVSEGNTAAGKLHKKSSELVKAEAQAAMIKSIAEELSEEEHAVYKRGRNAQAPSRAKNASMSDYRHATGLETLFGYLYLDKRYDRLTELIKRCLKAYEGQETGAYNHSSRNKGLV